MHRNNELLADVIYVEYLFIHTHFFSSISVNFLFCFNYSVRILLSQEMRILKFDTRVSGYSNRTLPVIHFTMDILSIKTTLIISLLVILKHYCNYFY
jgi:hypothetical protein